MPRAYSPSVGDVAKKKQVACDALHVADRYPVEGILDTAKDKGCDLIVMASHGRRGLARVLLGSETIEGADAQPGPGSRHPLAGAGPAAID